MHPQTELMLKALHSLMAAPRTPTILEQKLRAARRWVAPIAKGKAYPYSSLRQNTRLERKQARSLP